MKLTKKLIEVLKIELDKIKNKIADYKIVVQVDATIELKLLVKTELDESELFAIPTLVPYQNVIFVSQTTVEDYEFEKFKNNDEKVYFSHRRRLTELLEPENVQVAVPVVTFYSYKGGMGRTTALACFAAYMAMEHNKKVVVVDCDFEAPGLSNGNYFFIDTLQAKNGVIEYILDKEFNLHLGVERPNIIKDNYCYDEINMPNSKGKVYIIPAGNLSSANEQQKWYLEGLARLDLSNNFYEFIQDIIKDFELDDENSMILFDSRTGFNDTFATLAKYSQSIVGLFGINQQTVPGIEFFINHFLQQKPIIKRDENENVVFNKAENKNIWFIKGLANDSVEEDELKERIEAILLDAETDEKNPLHFKTSHIEFIKDLTLLGTPRLGEKKFYDLVQDINLKYKGNFKTFFDEIYKFHFEKKKPNTNIPITKTENIAVNNLENTATTTLSNLSLTKKIEVWKTQLSVDNTNIIKHNFLADIAYPKLTGEKQPQEKLAEEFFVRDFMADIFIKSKFIVLGGKGAGKTFLYRILNDKNTDNDVMIEKICYRASKKKAQHIFINVINAIEPRNISNDYNNIDKFTEATYNAYWKLVSCHAVFSHPAMQIYQQFSEDFSTWIKTIVDSNLNIHQDKLDNTLSQLRQINKQLKLANKKVILSFDRLDAILPLEKWRLATKPLLDFWGNNADFSEFLPKIFMRADLFNERKITANNFLSLQKYNVIDISWQADELFAYFFKITLNKPAKRELFYQYLLAYHFFADTENILQNVEQLIVEIEQEMDNNKQLILHKESFEKLIIPIFDKRADYYGTNNSNYKISYNWFADNMQDGLKQINIRSFWELITLSVNAIQADRQHTSFPLISPKYYTEKKYREEAAKIYYKDLESEIGNHSLTDFYNFFQLPERVIKFAKMYNYYEDEFKNILSLFIRQYPNTEILGLVDNSSDDTKKEGMIQWLINNGIITENLIGQGKNRKYTFPYFYRGLFNLKNPNKS